ncbi:hypothetical protein [Pseudomonas citronellolis]|uniref:hypothetical protein n=1 Tax=Pseudomonas citronellolis TaxID=53408 RepID=UPI000853A030|nr:hypothetical protein [Pseudomonas humi]
MRIHRKELLITASLILAVVLGLAAQVFITSPEGDLLFLGAVPATPGAGGAPVLAMGSHLLP